MGKDWEYSLMVSEAASKGGPQKYLDEIAMINWEKGYNEGVVGGFVQGSAITGLTVITLFASYKLAKHVVVRAQKKHLELDLREQELRKELLQDYSRSNNYCFGNSILGEEEKIV